jgi:hypothetical protein
MKKGLKEFRAVYDTWCSMSWLAIDLAQDLAFKFEYAKPEYAKITEEDVHRAYGLAGGGRKYPQDLIGNIHRLAEALGYTRQDYIDGADKRQGRGNVNIYIAGKGSVNCDIEDLMGEIK